jgi:segregation and condensation protein A
MTVFEKVLKRFEAEKNKPVHEIIQYPYTMEGQKEYIINEVFKRDRVSFAEVIAQHNNRIALIFNFLAILELLAMGSLGIQVGEGYNNFWITKPESVSQQG